MDSIKDITNFNEFLNRLRTALSGPLPGIWAQRKMAPPHRPVELRKPLSNDKVRDSAVLILLWEDRKQISTVFILRPEYDGIHSNQIAFPGGKYEPSDRDIVATALREANEEVGIIPETISILGQLSPLYIPPSQFWVYPIVSYTNIIPNFIPDPIEIKNIYPSNIFDFFKPDYHVIKDFKIQGKILPNIPCYKIEDQFMWGATAMIFSEFLEIIKTIVIDQTELSK